MSKERIAFIGIGVMGKSMAGHLLEAGYPLTVYNRTQSKADDLVARGATWADSPAAAAESADVVITTGFPADVEETYFGDSGVFNTIKTGAFGYRHDDLESAPLPNESRKPLARKGSAL